jgi:hypothetical protein
MSRKEYRYRYYKNINSFKAVIFTYKKTTLEEYTGFYGNRVWYCVLFVYSISKLTLNFPGFCWFLLVIRFSET